MRVLHRLTTIAVTTAVVACAGAAQARRTWVSFSPAQTSLTVGGGVSDYVGSTMRSTSRTGADWDARLLFGTRSPIAFEAGYTGTYNLLNGDRTTFTSGPAPYILQHSVDGALRINFIPWRVEPYIFGGVGYNRVEVYNRFDNPSVGERFRSGDNQLLVPAGGGLSVYATRHLTVDGRFTYRAVFNDDLLVDDPSARTDSYTVAARAGWAF
jgi:opacity protein-like surface antigen